VGITNPETPERFKQMKKILATTTIAASLLGGGLFLGPTLAGAQDGTTDTEQARVSWVEEALSGLVDDGTLTDAQVDAVEDALRDGRPEGRRGEGPHHVLEELGLDSEVVRDGLQSGMTLGEIAEANGLSAQDVVNSMTAAFSERLDAAVEAGRIDSETAEERKAEFAERAEAIVDGTAERPERPFGRRGHGGPGHHEGPALGAGDDLES
jgi:hypothetical protein